MRAMRSASAESGHYLLAAVAGAEHGTCDASSPHCDFVSRSVASCIAISGGTFSFGKVVSLFGLFPSNCVYGPIPPSRTTASYRMSTPCCTKRLCKCSVARQHRQSCHQAQHCDGYNLARLAPERVLQQPRAPLPNDIDALYGQLRVSGLTERLVVEPTIIRQRLPRVAMRDDTLLRAIAIAQSPDHPPESKRHANAGHAALILRDLIAVISRKGWYLSRR